MKVSDMLKIPKITTTEMQIIGNLQKAIKTKNFIAFLRGEEIEETQKQNRKEKKCQANIT